VRPNWVVTSPFTSVLVVASVEKPQHWLSPSAHGSLPRTATCWEGAPLGFAALSAAHWEFEGRGLKGMRQWGTELPSGYSCTGVGVMATFAVLRLNHPNQMGNSQRRNQRQMHK
jgi:hypothetical protein